MAEQRIHASGQEMQQEEQRQPSHPQPVHHHRHRHGQSDGAHQQDFGQESARFPQQTAQNPQTWVLYASGELDANKGALVMLMRDADVMVRGGRWIPSRTGSLSSESVSVKRSDYSQESNIDPSSLPVVVLVAVLNHPAADKSVGSLDIAEAVAMAEAEDTLITSVLRPLQLLAQNKQVRSVMHIERGRDVERGVVEAVKRFGASRVYIGMKKKYFWTSAPSTWALYYQNNLPEGCTLVAVHGSRKTDEILIAPRSLSGTGRTLSREKRMQAAAAAASIGMSDPQLGDHQLGQKSPGKSPGFRGRPLPKGRSVRPGENPRAQSGPLESIPTWDSPCDSASQLMSEHTNQQHPGEPPKVERQLSTGKLFPGLKARERVAEHAPLGLSVEKTLSPSSSLRDLNRLLGPGPSSFTPDQGLGPVFHAESPDLLARMNIASGRRRRRSDSGDGLKVGLEVDDESGPGVADNMSRNVGTKGEKHYTKSELEDEVMQGHLRHSVVSALGDYTTANQEASIDGAVDEEEKILCFVQSLPPEREQEPNWPWTPSSDSGRTPAMSELEEGYSFKSPSGPFKFPSSRSERTTEQRLSWGYSPMHSSTSGLTPFQTTDVGYSRRSLLHCPAQSGSGKSLEDSPPEASVDSVRFGRRGASTDWEGDSQVISARKESRSAQGGVDDSDAGAWAAHLDDSCAGEDVRLGASLAVGAVADNHTAQDSTNPSHCSSAKGLGSSIYQPKLPPSLSEGSRDKVGQAEESFLAIAANTLLLSDPTGFGPSPCTEADRIQETLEAKTLRNLLGPIRGRNVPHRVGTGLIPHSSPELASALAVVRGDLRRSPHQAKLPYASGTGPSIAEQEDEAEGRVPSGDERHLESQLSTPLWVCRGATPENVGFQSNSYNMRSGQHIMIQLLEKGTQAAFRHRSPKRGSVPQDNRDSVDPGSCEFADEQGNRPRSPLLSHKKTGKVLSEAGTPPECAMPGKKAQLMGEEGAVPRICLGQSAVAAQNVEMSEADGAADQQQELHEGNLRPSSVALPDFPPSSSALSSPSQSPRPSMWGRGGSMGPARSPLSSPREATTRAEEALSISPPVTSNPCLESPGSAQASPRDALTPRRRSPRLPMLHLMWKQSSKLDEGQGHGAVHGMAHHGSSMKLEGSAARQQRKAQPQQQWQHHCQGMRGGSVDEAASSLDSGEKRRRASSGGNIVMCPRKGQILHPAIVQWRKAHAFNEPSALMWLQEDLFSCTPPYLWGAEGEDEGSDGVNLIEMRRSGSSGHRFAAYTELLVSTVSPAGSQGGEFGGVHPPLGNILSPEGLTGGQTRLKVVGSASSDKHQSVHEACVVETMDRTRSCTTTSPRALPPEQQMTPGVSPVSANTPMTNSPSIASDAWSTRDVPISAGDPASISLSSATQERALLEHRQPTGEAGRNAGRSNPEKAMVRSEGVVSRGRANSWDGERVEQQPQSVWPTSVSPDQRTEQRVGARVGVAGARPPRPTVPAVVAARHALEEALESPAQALMKRDDSWGGQDKESRRGQIAGHMSRKLSERVSGSALSRQQEGQGDLEGIDDADGSSQQRVHVVKFERPGTAPQLGVVNPRGAGGPGLAAAGEHTRLPLKPAQAPGQPLKTRSLSASMVPPLPVHCAASSTSHSPMHQVLSLEQGVVMAHAAEVKDSGESLPASQASLKQAVAAGARSIAPWGTPANAEKEARAGGSDASPPESPAEDHEADGFVFNVDALRERAQTPPSSMGLDKGWGPVVEARRANGLSPDHLPSGEGLGDVSTLPKATARVTSRTLSPRSLGNAEDGTGCRFFSSMDLHAATNSYDKSNLVGSGGSGVVYQGCLHGCQVAVKLLNGRGQEGKVDELFTEVNVLSRVRHPHVVLLMGYCPSDHAIVYEFMGGGSLKSRLHKTVRKDAAPPTPGTSEQPDRKPHVAVPRHSSDPTLPWYDRIRIASEIAGALLFLHRHRPPILHGDIKPDNILLDTSGAAKIGDVGLARLIPEEFLAITFKLKGTIGYFDPESFCSGDQSVASDVYSLGLVLIQLFTGIGDIKVVHKHLACVASSQGKRDMQRVLDVFLPLLESFGMKWPRALAARAIQVALSCIEKRAVDRADLGSVVCPELNELAQAAAREKAARTQRLESILLCPLTNRKMKNPVVAADGFTYDESGILEWYDEYNISPVTGDMLAHKFLIPNAFVQELLARDSCVHLES